MKSVSCSIGLVFTIKPYNWQNVVGQITTVSLIYKLSSRRRREFLAPKAQTSGEQGAESNTHFVLNKVDR